MTHSGNDQRRLPTTWKQGLPMLVLRGGKRQVTDWVRDVLVHTDYPTLNRGGKETVRRYLEHQTGLSKAMVLRHVLSYCARQRVFGDESVSVTSASTSKSVTTHSNKVTWASLAAVFLLTGIAGGTWVHNNALQAQLLSTQADVLKLERAEVAQVVSPTGTVLASPASRTTVVTSADADRLEILRQTIFARIERLQARLGRSAAANGVTNTSTVASLFELTGKGNDGQILMLLRGRPMWVNMPGSIAEDLDPASRHRPYDPAGGTPRDYGGGGTSGGGTSGGSTTGGGGSNISLPISINSDTSGVLSQSRGGLGFSSYTLGDLLVGTSTGGLVRLGVGSNGYVLTSSGGTLMWAQSTGGGGTSSGMSISSGDSRYVRKQGDLMTGALVIQNGNTHTATATPLLNVRGTMSGMNLYISGSGSVPMIYTNSGNGRVGIGTSSPSTTLHVSAPSGTTTLTVQSTSTNNANITLTNGDGNSYQFQNRSSGNTYLRMLYNGSTRAIWSGSYLQLGTANPPVAMIDVNGTARLRGVSGSANAGLTVNAVGNVGVGTASPRGAFEVVGSGTFVGTISGSLITQNGAGNNYFMGNVGIGTTSASSPLHILSDSTSIVSIVNTSGTKSFTMGFNGSGDFAIDAQNCGGPCTGTMILLASNTNSTVGIGVSSPDAKLDVLGTISGSLITQNGAGNNYFMGNVGIGNTSPEGLLHLGSSTTGQAVFQYLDATQVNSVGFVFRTAGSNMWTQFRDGGNRLRFTSAAGEVLSLSQNGNVGLGVIAPSVKFQVTGSGSFTGTNARVAVGKTTALAALDVVGTISGSALTINGSITNTGALTTRGAVTFRSLTGCSVLQTDANGTLSCGVAPGTFGSGNVLTIGNSRYVSKQGDTMTGALMIQNGNASTNTAAALLNVRGTMSGRSLMVSGSGSNPLFRVDSTTGRVTVGVGTGSDLMNIKGGRLAIVRPGVSSYGNQLTYHFSVTNYQQGGTYGELTLGVDTTGNAIMQSYSGLPIVMQPSGNNVAISKLLAKAKLDVLGTISGSALTINGSITNTGSLTTRGTVTFRSLTGCAALVTNSVGVLSCGNPTGTFGSGNVLTIGNSRYVSKQGDTMTGALTIQNGNTHSATATPLLNVRGTMSGRSLYITGTGSTPLLTTNIGTGRVGIGTSAPTGLLDIVSDGLNSDVYFRSTINNSTLTQYIRSFDDTGIPVNLKFQSFGPNIANFADGTFQGGYMGTSTDHNLNIITNNITRIKVLNTGFVGIGTSLPGAKLAVSGSVVIGRDIASHVANAALDVVGTISGSALTVTSLKGCSSLQTNTAGVLSCGSGGAGTFSSGNVLTIGNSRYVSKQGDTMTGALTIQNGNTHTATTTPLLNVRGTMSGRSLWISGTGSSPLLMTNVLSGRVGIGVANPGATLEVGGNYAFGKGSIYINPNSGQHGYLSLNADADKEVGIQFRSAGATKWWLYRSTDGNNDLVLDSFDGGNAFTIREGTGFMGIGKSVPKARLDVLGTISGSRLTISGNASITGALVVVGRATAQNMMVADGSYYAFGSTNTRLEGSSTYAAFVVSNEQMRILSTGNVGIGTTTPGARLSVSGSTVISDRGNVIAGRAAKATLDVIGTISGSYLSVARNANITGSLIVRRDFTLYDSASNNSLKTSGVNVSTFEVDLVGANAGTYYFTSDWKVGIGTSTPKATLGVAGTISGSNLNISGGANITGALLVRGGITSRGTISGAGLVINGLSTLYGNLVPGADNAYDLGTTSARWRHLYLSGGTLNIGTATSNGAISYQTNGSEGLRFYGNSSGLPTMSISSGGLVGIGTTTPRQKLQVDGNLLVQNGSMWASEELVLGGNPATGITRYAQILSDTGQNDTTHRTYRDFFFETDTGDDTAGTKRLTIKGVTGFVGVGTSAPKAKLDVVGTISGSTLNVSGGANITGALLVKGRIRTYLSFQGSNGSLLADSGGDGYWVLYNSAATSFSMLQFGGTSSSFPGIKRAGTAFQFRLANDSAYTDIAAAAITGSSLKIYGNISGSSLYVANLNAASCDVKSTNGVLSCGTDATGGAGTFGSGNVITIGNSRYVSKQGDTMTGALTIQNGNTHTATSTPLLNVRGTMSGKQLWISGSGATPLLYTGNGRIGIGTAKPVTTLDIRNGTLSLWRSGTGGSAAVLNNAFGLRNINIISQVSGSLIDSAHIAIGNDTNGVKQEFIKGIYGDNFGSPAFFQMNGDETIAQFNFRGVNSVGDLQTAASIRALTDGLQDFDTPGRLEFYTNDGGGFGSTNLTQRMRIDHRGNVRIGSGTAEFSSKLDVAGAISGASLLTNGNITPGMDNRYDLGTNAARWRHLYLSGGTLNIGTATSSGAISYQSAGFEGLKFYGKASSATPSMVISSGGLVGIGTAAPRTKLDVVGTISGGSLLVSGTSTLKGFVSVFSPSTTNTLMTLGDNLNSSGYQANYTVRSIQVLDNSDLTGTTFFISPNGGGLGVNRAVATGLHGAFEVNGAMSGSSLTLSNLRNCNLDTDANGLITCGTDATVGGSTFGSGNVLSMGDNRYTKKAGDTMTGTLVIQNGNTHTATNTPLLNVRGTMSGRSLFITGSGSAPLLMTSIARNRVGIGTSSPRATLDVVGTISGSSLFVANLNATACDVKAVNGVLSCGTDATGGGSGSFGSGNVLTIGNARYVNKAGDTMTGTLVIQNGNTHSATTTPLLNVRGTMSGRSLYITGSGSAPLIVTNSLNGRVGIGVSSPDTTLEVLGNMSGSRLFLADGTATNPALVFTSDTNTGIYHSGTDSISISAGANQTAIFSANGLQIDGELAVSASMYAASFSAGQLTIGTSGASVASLHAFGGVTPYVMPNGATVFRDGFTEGVTTTLASHTPDSVGTSWTILLQTGGATMRAQSTGKADATATVANSVILYTADATYGSADYEAKITVDTGTTGTNPVLLAVRVQDANNMYIVKFSGTATSNGLYKIVAGTPTLLHSMSNFTILAGDTVRLRIVGDDIAVYKGNTLIGSASDTDITAAGKAGFGLGAAVVGTDDASTNWDMDNFQVTNYTTTGIPAAVLENGFVGIDTQTPGAQLAVSGSTVIGNAIGSRAAKAQLDVVGSISGSSLFIANLNAANCDVKAVNGVLSCGTDATGGAGTFGSGNVITIGNSRYVSKQGDTMTGALTIQNGNTHTPTATPLLNVRGTLSGAGLVINGTSTFYGNLVPGYDNRYDLGTNANRWRHLYLSGGTLNIGTATSSGAISYQSAGTEGLKFFGKASGPASMFISSGGLVGIGTLAPRTQLEVFGTISGSTIRISNTLSTSGALTVQGSVTLRGVAGCSNGIQSDANGVLSCNAGGGISQATGDSRYVNIGGDTMTGALSIQNGNTHSATSTPLLNVRGTMSGRFLYISGTGVTIRPSAGTNAIGLNVAATMSGRNIVIWGTGSTPILSTRAGNAALGIGVLNPGETLDVNGNMRSTNFRNYGLTRTLPTTVNDEVDIGSFSTTLGGAVFEVDIASPNSNFSMSKHYTIPVYFSATGGAWHTVIADKSSGPFSGNDYDLDINVSSGVVQMRIRRTVGSTAGTMYVHVRQYGVNTDSFTPSTATSSVAAPSTFYGSSQITQLTTLGFVGIGKITPKALLDVQGTISGSTILSSGKIGVGTTSPRTPIEVKGVISGSTLIASYLGLGGNINPTVPLDVQGEIRTTNFRTQSVTRTVPTTVNDEVDIGSYSFTSGGGSLYIDVVVPSSGFSVAKQYLVPVYFASTGWVTLLPLSNTGPYSGNDFDVDINISGGSVSFRIRRTAGNTAGTAYVSMKQQGVNTDAFTPASATSSVAAPTSYYGASILTQNATNGYVGIGTMSPKTKLDVVGTISGSQLKIAGSIFGSGGGLIKGNFGIRGVLSGSTLTISNNAGISGSLVVRSNIFARGNLTATGNLVTDGTVTLRGVAGCTNGIQSDSNGVLSCAVGGGISQATADSRYVNIGGDTMTGTLVIQNGNTHSATATPLLNVRGTMSGKQLYITGSGGSSIPLISTNNGRIGVGTTDPLGFMDVRGPLEQGLIGWFAGDEGGGTYTFDKSITGGSGKLLLGATFAQGKNGRALSLDGTDDYVTLGANKRISGQQVPVTITGWFKQTSTSGNRILYSAYQSVGSSQLWSMIRLESGVMVYYTSTSNGSYQSAGSLTAAGNQWHHFAIVVSGTTSAPRVTFYLDNKVQTATLAAVSTTPDLTVPISIGANYAGGEPFAGLIDELRIYNREINSREVAELARLTEFSIVGGTVLGGLRIESGASLNVAGLISGSTLNIFGSGGSVTNPMIYTNSNNGRVGIGTSTPKAKLDVQGTISGALITQNGAGTNYLMGSVAIGRSSVNTNMKLDVVGTISGSALRISGNISASGAVMLEGSLSGATIRGFGLNTDCDDGTNSKVLWDATTGRFSCGADQGGAGGGISFAFAEGVYVNQKGDTMTGALVIQSGNTAGAIASPLLNVRGTMSGKTLYLTGSGTKANALEIRKTGTGYAMILSGSVIQQNAYGSPKTLSGVNLGTDVRIIAVQGQYAYVGTTSRTGNDFYIINVSNPNAPRVVSGMDFGTDVLAVTVAGKYAYIGLTTRTGNDFVIVDITNPNSPVTLGGADVTGDASQILVNGRYAYVNGGGILGIRLFDVSNPYKPVRISTCQPDTPSSNFVLRGTSLIFGHGNSGLLQADYANPALPTGSCGGAGSSDGNSGKAIVSVGDYIYVLYEDALSPGATFRTYRSTDITTSVATLTFSIAGTPTGYDLKVAGRYAYLSYTDSAGFKGMKIIDIANPLNPIEVGSYAGAADIRTITIAGKYAYIGYSSVGGNDMRILDLAGADLPTASIGNLLAGELLVDQGLRVMQTANIGDALTVGRGGIHTQGSLTVFASGSGAGVNAMEVRSSSGAPLMVLTTSGALGIGSGAALNARMTVFTDNNFNQAAIAIKSKETTATQNMFTITTDYNSTANLVYRITASGATYADAPFNSAGADYAEWFPSDPTKPLKAGDAVCLDPAFDNRVKKCDREGDPNLMGIVSTKPSFVGNAVAGSVLDGLGLPVPGYTLVGLIGQLDSTATTVGSGGVIKPGDSLTSSSIPGVLRRALPGEPTVGVALTGVSGSTGSIRVLIARSNKSLTVDAVEERVRTSVAALKIDDEIRSSMEAALSDSAFDERISTAVTSQLSALHPLQDRVATLEETINNLSAQLLALSGSTVRGGGETNLNGSSLTLTGSLNAADLSSENTLTVGRDARIGGDLYLEGALIMTGDMQFNGNVATGKLTAASGSTINGTLNVAGDLLLNRNLTFTSGATLSASQLLVSGALLVRGPITIDGLATFLGDVNVHGQLTVSSRQAGFAVIEVGQKEVTVKFEPPFTATPVVTATSDAFALWRLKSSSMTGFTLEIQAAATERMKFTWQALTVDAPMTASGAGVSSAGSQTIFPLDEHGVPVSSSAIWNACIRHEQPLDPVTGQPFSCSRYTPDLYIWTHPDFPNMTFVWNDTYTPPLLVLPDGYVSQIITSSSSSSSDSSMSSSSDSSSSDSSSSDSSSSESSVSSESSSSEQSSNSSSSESSDSSASSDSSSSEGSSSSQ